MREVKRRLFVFLLAAVGFVAVLVVPGSASAAVKATYSVGSTATCVVTNPQRVKLTWKVSNKKIKVIKKNNYGLKFRAETPGSVKITATASRQTLTWKITIKRKTFRMGKVEVDAGNTATLAVDGGNGSVTWEVPESGLDVASTSNFGLSFVASEPGEYTVVAVSKKYRWVWTVVIKESSGNTTLDNLIGALGSLSVGDYSQEDLEHVANQIFVYLIKSPYSSSVTEDRLANFCVSVIAYVMTAGSMPTDAELESYMDEVSYYLYTDASFVLPDGLEVVL